MIQYLQKTKYDCGIRALCYVLQVPYEDMKKIWNWNEHNDFRDNFKDSPIHHYNVMFKLNTKHRNLSLTEILEGNYVASKTMVLIHFEENPYTLQHWVVLEKPNEYSKTEDKIFMNYGDGTIHGVTKNDFIKLFTGGFPNCAYIVGEGECKLSWYEKLYCAFINLFV